MKIFIDVLIAILTIGCCVYFGLNPNLTVSGLSLFIILIGLLITIHNIIVFFGYIASKSGKRFGKFERKVKQLDKTDLKKIKDYYREILKDNSPLILGYLDDFELDDKKIIAELLYLKKKKIINIEDGKIVKLNVIENLQASEKMILDRIIDGKLKFNDSKLDLRKLVENECKNKDFISKQNSAKGILILILILKFFLVLITVSVFVFGLYYLMIKKDSINSLARYFKRLEKFDWSLIVCAITVLTGSLYYFYIQNYLAKYNKEKGNLYKRTKKGRELNKKLEGLKNYLKDYSILDEREAKEIELWEDYLIYSVMFGQNKKIIEEYEKYIEIN